MKTTDAFIASIETPPGYSLGPQQEAAIRAAFEKFLRSDLLAMMIDMKPRRAGKGASS